MNLLSEDAIKTFNLLIIGQRGVGKTVFLAGSYTELHTDTQQELPRQLWFDCQDTQVQKNMDKILNYIVQNRQYPPATTQITNFSFSLKRHSLWGVETLCHFRWLDIPGEICTIHSLDFRRIVSSSHGCCVLIDAYALTHNNAYVQNLESIIIQVGAIANLVYLNRLYYSFAVILTKCDLLEAGSSSRQQLEEVLQQITTRLDATKANYQTFYSFIPIVHTASASILGAQGAAAALLWLVEDLNKAHNSGHTKNLLDFVFHPRPSSSQPQQEVVNGSVESLSSSVDKLSRFKNIFGLYFPTQRKYILLIALAVVGLVGVFGLLFVEYQRGFQRQSTSLLDTPINIATLQERGQYDQAVPLMEKLVQQKPEQLELRLQLAYLYALKGQMTQAETAYDQVLTKQKNNFEALLGKAVMRNAQGDTKTALTLFAQAEKAAPANLKVRIRTMAQNVLHPSVKRTPSPVESNK